MNRVILFCITTLCIGAGCPKAALTERVDQLEKQVVILTNEIVKMQAAPPEPQPAPGPSAEDEEAAKALYLGVMQALTDLDAEKAKADFKTLMSKYGDTTTAQRAKRMESELEVIGKEAGKLNVAQWYQGQVAMSDGKATLLVFWEKWCPHCKREIPILEQTYQTFKEQGLNLVGLTKGNRGVTDEDIRAFIDEKDVTYPTAKDDGSLSSRFAIRGIPAAVLIKDGTVVWRGHPARVNSEMLNKVLQ